MKIAGFFWVALAAAASIPLMAQQAETPDSQKAVYDTQGPMGFGDASASHSWEMSNVTCDLMNRLDSRTAKVGDRVVLKTNDKVQTADGTVIPRGTRLVGHVTQVQARDATHPVAQLGLAIDHAELKGGQSIAIYTLIRGAFPLPSLSDMNPMATEDPTAAGPQAGGRNGSGQSGYYSDAIHRTSQNTTSVGDRTGSNTDPNQAGSVQLAGHGDPNDATDAHKAAAARSVPHPTAIPGLMVAGDSAASGVFLARQMEIDMMSGTQLQLGIIGGR